MIFRSSAQRRAVFAKTRFRYKPGEGIMPLGKIHIAQWGDEGDVTPKKLHDWQDALPEDIVFDPVTLRPMQSIPTEFIAQEGRHRFLSEKEVGSEGIPYVMRQTL